MKLIHLDRKEAVLRIRIRDGCLFDTWIRDPGWEKVSIRIRDPG